MKTIRLRDNGLHFPKGTTAVTRSIAFNMIDEALNDLYEGGASFKPVAIDMKLPQTITIELTPGANIPKALSQMVVALKMIQYRNNMIFKFSVVANGVQLIFDNSKGVDAVLELWQSRRHGVSEIVEG